MERSITTLADLKRKLKVGQGVKLVAYGGMQGNQATTDSRLNKVRYVVKTQGNGVYLNEDKTAQRGAFLDFPKASLLEVDDKGFKIFRSGERELTEEEKQIIAHEPEDAEQERIDAISDGSTMYRRRKSYYEESGYPYLMGVEKQNGKRFVHNKGKDMIEDDNLKGELVLAYEWAE